MKKFFKYPIRTMLIVAFVLSVTSVVMFSIKAHAAQPSVDLGTAAPFAILSGTPNITDTGFSAITGNVGLYPGPGSGITGLTCAQVTGTIYARDGTGNVCFTVNAPLLLAAKNDLVTAYNDAAGRTPVTTVPTELGGTTLHAGVYKSASTTFGITSGAGHLVLDGQGDSDAVFIFEMNSGATGLTVGPNSVVDLVNDAQACNVFWRLNTATLNTNAVFKGNILALTSITVANGTDIVGRLLARNGNVTLDDDTIAKPAACTTPTTSSSPKLPNTGTGPVNKSGTSWYIIIPSGIIVTLLSLYVARKKRTI